MSPSLINQLLIAFLCAVMGFVAGVLVTLLWQEHGRNKQIPGELPEGLVKGQHDPIVRLWRDKKNGKLLTELEGNIYTENKAINKSLRKELKATAMQWAAWLIEGEEKAAPSVQAPSVQAPPVPAPQAQPMQAPPPVPAPAQTPIQLQAAAAPIVPPVTATQGSSQPQATKGDKKATEAAKPEAPKTMLEEIDEIIQEMIEGTPLESQKVRLASDPRSNVVVWVGSKHFEGVDAVDDPEIKALLRRAVAAWEKRYEKR